MNFSDALFDEIKPHILKAFKVYHEQNPHVFKVNKRKEGIMKPETIKIDEVEYRQVKKLLKKMSFKPLAQSNGTKNGSDIWALKNGRVYSIEVKKAKSQNGNNFQVRPVENNRKKDDYIAIVMPSGYVLFEPMKDHLKVCSSKGTRNIHGLS